MTNLLYLCRNNEDRSRLFEIMTIALARGKYELVERSYEDNASRNFLLPRGRQGGLEVISAGTNAHGRGLAPDLVGLDGAFGKRRFEGRYKDDGYLSQYVTRELLDKADVVLCISDTLRMMIEGHVQHQDVRLDTVPRYINLNLDRIKGVQDYLIGERSHRPSSRIKRLAANIRGKAFRDDFYGVVEVNVMLMVQYEEHVKKILRQMENEALIHSPT